jgi:hypothetical protein
MRGLVFVRSDPLQRVGIAQQSRDFSRREEMSPLRVETR